MQKHGNMFQITVVGAKIVPEPEKPVPIKEIGDRFPFYLRLV